MTTHQHNKSSSQPERRRDGRQRVTVLSWALGLVGAVTVLFLVYLLVYD